MGYERVRVGPERSDISTEDLSMFDAIARRSRLERTLVITTLDIFYDSQQDRIEALEDHINDPLSTTIHDVDRTYGTAHEAIREVALAAIRSKQHSPSDRIEMLTELFMSAGAYQQQMFARYDMDIEQYDPEALWRSIAVLYLSGRHSFADLVQTKYDHEFSQELDEIMEKFWDHPNFAMYHELSKTPEGRHATSMDRFNETLEESAGLLHQLETSDDDVVTDRILNQTHRSQLSHMVAMLESMDSLAKNFRKHEDRVVCATGMFIRLDQAHSSIVARLTKQPETPLDYDVLQQEINDMPQDSKNFADAVYKRYARMFHEYLESVRVLYADEY